MVGTAVTRCLVEGCDFKTFSEQPSMALAKHHKQSHQHAILDPRIVQAQGLREMLRTVTVERDALRDHLEKFHICTHRCVGQLA